MREKGVACVPVPGCSMCATHRLGLQPEQRSEFVAYSCLPPQSQRTVGLSSDEAGAKRCCTQQHTDLLQTWSFVVDFVTGSNFNGGNFDKSSEGFLLKRARSAPTDTPWASPSYHLPWHKPCARGEINWCITSLRCGRLTFKFLL